MSDDNNRRMNISILNKLNYYGVNDTELSWFQSYLTERSQYVDINGITLNVLAISTGVPQGSILGRLLFLIYMNDIPVVSTFFKYICMLTTPAY